MARDELRAHVYTANSAPASSQATENADTHNTAAIILRSEPGEEVFQIIYNTLEFRADWIVACGFL